MTGSRAPGGELVADLVATEATPAPRGSGSARPRRGRGLLGSLLPPFVAFALVFVAWDVLVRWQQDWLLPSPLGVLGELVGNLELYVRHGQTTLAEALAGFAVGTLLAFGLAVAMAHSRLLERALFPLAVVVKVTPVVAFVPILIVWFGFGMAPKVIITALITFFPVLVNAVVGFRSIDPQTHEVLQSLDASPGEVFWKLRLPNSLPYLFAAAKVSVSLAVIGAVVAEWEGSSRGLGNIITRAQNNLALERMFAAILALAVLGVGLTLLVGLAERRWLAWHSSQEVVS